MLLKYYLKLFLSTGSEENFTNKIFFMYFMCLKQEALLIKLL